MTCTTSAQSSDSFVVDVFTAKKLPTSPANKFLMLRAVCFILALCVVTAIPSPAQTFPTVTYFDGADGFMPTVLTQGADGNLYGTTLSGGANGFGTVFRITPAGALTTLYSFCSLANCADGNYPDGLIQATDGNFYGITQLGGTSSHCLNGGSCGLVFKITSSGAFSTLYNFCSEPYCADGAVPGSLIQASDGNFYGTTSGMNCFAGLCGSIFKLTPGGALTTLYSFNGTNGEGPTGLIQGADGNLYGTVGDVLVQTEPAPGYVFQITTEGVLTILAPFDGTDGVSPGGLMQATNGNFYGTAANGGAYKASTLFEVTPVGVLTDLYNFSTARGGPVAGLIQAADGNIYGIVGGGPNFSPWSVFEMSLAGKLSYLNSYSAGVSPSALMQAANGNFYVTTQWGGINNSSCYGLGCGTIATFPSQPTATLSVSSLTFGDHQALNETSASLPVRLISKGVVLLSFSDVTVSGNFTITKNTCAGAALIVNQDCSVRVAFTPTVLGPQTGTLTFTDNGLNSPQTVALSGTGVAQATLTPSSYNFSDTFLGLTSPPRSFELMNNLSTTLTGISFSTSGDFGISGSTCGTTLSAKSSCTISVTFTPTQKGIRTGQLSVSDGANNTPQTASLSGTGD